MKDLHLSDKELLNLEHMAGLFFTISELATIMGMPDEDFRMAYNTPGTVIRETINRGRLLSMASVRTATLSSAINGSTPAQTAIAQAITNMQIYDHD